MGRCPPLAFPRSAVLASVLAATLNAHRAQAIDSLVQGGMQQFAENNVETALKLYDKQIELQPQSSPYLWQRGLALFYLEQYQIGAKQFEGDVAVNPNDTEEFIWHLLCLARLKGSLEAARPFMLKVGTDRRRVMRAAQRLFEGDQSARENLESYISGSSIRESFYANLYLGLFLEVEGDIDGARRYITQATRGPYASVQDPMCDVARVHLLRRGWSSA